MDEEMRCSLKGDETSGIRGRKSGELAATQRRPFFSTRKRVCRMQAQARSKGKTQPQKIARDYRSVSFDGGRQSFRRSLCPRTPANLIFLPVVLLASFESMRTFRCLSRVFPPSHRLGIEMSVSFERASVIRGGTLPMTSLFG